MIEAFGAESPRLTLSEVARRTAITPGTAQRILRTLESLGYVGLAEGRFSLRPRTLQLGYAYLASLPLTSIAQPMLSALMQATDETCSLALLDGADVVYVARAPARRLRRDYMAVGTRLPAHATSVGKVLLATLAPPALEALLERHPPARLSFNTLQGAAAVMAAAEQAARDGFALNDQETMMGMRAIAVPIIVNGRAIAAMGLSAEVGRVEPEDMRQRLLPQLRQAAGALAAALAASDQPVGLLQCYPG